MTFYYIDSKKIYKRLFPQDFGILLSHDSMDRMVRKYPNPAEVPTALLKAYKSQPCLVT